MAHSPRAMKKPDLIKIDDSYKDVPLLLRSWRNQERAQKEDAAFMTEAAI